MFEVLHTHTRYPPSVSCPQLHCALNLVYEAQAYKGQVTKDLRKQRFFKMADVKGIAALKGATGTAILQSLRHLKRLRLVDGGYILQAS